MEDYNVVIDEPAEQDLRAVVTYIAEILHESAAAERIFNAIQAAISGLGHRPFRFPLVDDEKYAQAGLRKLPVENYVVFYVASKETHTVHVWRVLYSRREWQSLV